jgi:hypothetical protein
MSAGEPQVFNGITPDQYAKLADKAKGAGIDLSGNNGTASKFGVEVTWNYSPADQVLTMQCLKAPFFMSRADVDSRIHKLVQDSLA